MSRETSSGATTFVEGDNGDSANSCWDKTDVAHREFIKIFFLFPFNHVVVVGWGRFLQEKVDR